MEEATLPTREQALALLREHVKSESMIRHCLASEAVMRHLARRFGEDEAKWGLAGLLHDVDVELTNADLALHGLKAVEMLQERGLPDDLVQAIKLHNEKAHDEKRSTRFHKALAAGETITGLITAVTLVYPDKKLAGVKAKSIVKRMKEKNFAASVSREIILECEELGIPLPEFAETCLQAMQGIASDLGL